MNAPLPSDIASILLGVWAAGTVLDLIIDVRAFRFLGRYPITSLCVEHRETALELAMAGPNTIAWWWRVLCIAACWWIYRALQVWDMIRRHGGPDQDCPYCEHINASLVRRVLW